MHTQDLAFTHFNEKLFPILVDYHISKRALGQLSDRFLANFADLVFEAFKVFRFHTVFKENPFLKEDTLFAFAREYVYMSFVTAQTMVNDVKREELDKNLMAVEQEYRSAIQSPFPENALAEEQQQWEEARHNAMKVAKTARSEHMRKVEDLTMQVFFSYFGQIPKMYAVCQSPLEQAFLIGLFAYESDHPDWLRLLERLAAQYEVGSYRMDFALFDKNEDDTRKLAIELDGHTYHERTEEQAVHDRARDRELQHQGWQVLRFHRREIEEDLEGCVRQTMRVLRRLPNHTSL